jgi:Na+-driven multidrug efflux pump
MKAPSAILLLTAVAQVVIGGVCGLGLGPVPRFGMAGVAAGQVAASAIGAALLILQLRSGRSAVTLTVGSVRPQPALFGAILRTGATAAVSPIMSIATIILLNRLVSGYGPTVLAGFGIGTRLEFLLTPLSFAIGVASVPLVGTAIGAGMVARARAAAWIAGGLSAAAMATIGIGLGLFPGLWVGIFTSDPATLAVASDYFHWVGPAYGFFGAGMSLFFSSLAAGRVVGMLLAGASRLLVIVLGGLVLVPLAAPLWMVFALITVAMVTYGSMAMLVMARAKWGMESTPR